MKKIHLLCLLISMLLSLSACGPKMISKKDAFPKMYDERPLSILVLPPINATTAADAKDYYMTTIAEPLSFAGYYIYPLEVTTDILKAEGLYDTELMMNLPAEKFRQYFGADAVLYIKILKWDTSYYVVGGNVTVAADFLLRSTTTGEDLWKYDGIVTINTSGSNSGGGLVGLAFAIVETAIKTAMTDYVPIAKQVNTITVSSMPLGKYHSNYDKDKEVQIIQKVTNKSLQ